ncbi:hypothetical protein KGQ34_02900, partial [Patescibacteria group bacterium]|nr:hypothetical protein [Patescibacteria group bacterium]
MSNIASHPMTHAVDDLLRPFIRWYFQSWFWKYLPWRKKILWFFCSPYFVVGEAELCRTFIML